MVSEWFFFNSILQLWVVRVIFKYFRIDDKVKKNIKRTFFFVISVKIKTYYFNLYQMSSFYPWSS